MIPFGSVFAVALLLKIMSEVPTSTRPQIMLTIPSHMYGWMTRLLKATDSSAVKIITAPDQKKKMAYKKSDKNVFLCTEVSLRWLYINVRLHHIT